MGDDGLRLASIDRRTRTEGEGVAPAPEVLVSEIEELVSRHGDLVADGIRRLELRGLGFDVAEIGWRGSLGPDGLSEDIPDDAMVLDLTVGQLADLVRDQRSLNSFSVNRDVRMHQATMDHVLDWDAVWRALLDGWAVHRTGDVDFVGSDGAPLDLHHAFGPEDEPAEIAHFLREAGYVRLRGWLDPEDMATIAADIDAALPRYTKDDGRSWWATLSDGSERCVRMLHFVEHSPTTARVLTSGRWDHLRSVLAGADTLAPPAVRGNVIEALIKPLGVVQGISDIPWHRDCSLGRHSLRCCGVTVGVSVSDGGADRGQLRALAGSHRANVRAVGLRPDGDLPIVPLPTQAGDLTVHLSCTLHEATPPTVGERRVMYTGFSLPDIDGSAAAQRAWERRNQAHKLQSQPPSQVPATAG